MKILIYTVLLIIMPLAAIATTSPEGKTEKSFEQENGG